MPHLLDTRDTMVSSKLDDSSEASIKSSHFQNSKYAIFNIITLLLTCTFSPSPTAAAYLPYRVGDLVTRDQVADLVSLLISSQESEHCLEIFYNSSRSCEELTQSVSCLTPHLTVEPYIDHGVMPHEKKAKFMAKKMALLWVDEDIDPCLPKRVDGLVLLALITGSASLIVSTGILIVIVIAVRKTFY